jgi:hypothetical protein
VGQAIKGATSGSVERQEGDAAMSEGPEQTGRDQDSEANSPAGAASPQAEQADDKEQAEGGEDQGEPGS